MAPYLCPPGHEATQVLSPRDVDLSGNEKWWLLGVCIATAIIIILLIVVSMQYRLLRRFIDFGLGRDPRPPYPLLHHYRASHQPEPISSRAPEQSSETIAGPPYSSYRGDSFSFDGFEQISVSGSAPAVRRAFAVPIQSVQKDNQEKEEELPVNSPPAKANTPEFYTLRKVQMSSSPKIEASGAPASPPQDYMMSGALVN
ncbi:hypothetical protein F4802DRAFT_615669 [Xylaria palmicola]|nr:hypothetical protein F4802DRAFT_615669 [Xylaria palmicola]